jgi:hypothetical protein
MFSQVRNRIDWFIPYKNRAWNQKTKGVGSPNEGGGGLLQRNKKGQLKKVMIIRGN